MASYCAADKLRLAGGSDRAGEARGPDEDSSYEFGNDTVCPALSCVPGHPTYPELLLLGAGEGVCRGAGGSTGEGSVVAVVAVVALV